MNVLVTGRPGSSAAGSWRSCSSAAIASCPSTTSWPATRRTSPSSRAIRGLRPLEVGDVRDRSACRRWARRGRRDRPPGRLDLGPGLDRRPGDDVRERRRRHVQPARGRPLGRGPVPVHEHVHGLRPGATPAIGIDETPPDEAGLAIRGLEAGRRGADALVSPRLWPADDRRPAVQHVRPVPALGRGGRRRGDLHPPRARWASRCASTATGPRRATCCTSPTAPGSWSTRCCPTRSSARS